MPGSDSFKRFVEAIQSDSQEDARLFQVDQVEFPDVPEFGGVFRTRKGSYEAVFLDPVPPATVELPRWRRLSDNTLYEAGDSIPATT